MGKKLLVVDDSVFLQSLLKDRLEREGFDIVQAFDGREGLEKVKKEAFDLVLLDVKMPYVDGFEVCRRIKADPALKKIPVMFLTVMAQKADIETGIAAGAEAYFAKPYESGELIKEVRKLLKMA